MAYFRLKEALSILSGYLFPSTGIQDRVSKHSGALAFGVLRSTADVVNGDTITIGTNVFEIDVINTDLTENTVGALDDGSGGLSEVTMGGVHSRDAGDLFRVENEIMKIVRVLSTTVVVAARGRCGTTAATHVTDSDVYVSDAAPAANTPVGVVATLTPTVWTAALVQEINNAKAGDERPTAKASTLYGTIIASIYAVDEVHIKALTAAVLALATTETFNQAANDWSAVTMVGGQAVARLQYCVLPARVATANEVTLGEMWFFLPSGFTPRMVLVYVYTTSTKAPVAWIGDKTLAAGSILLDNTGGTDFSANETVQVVAFE